jgi:hypothetical protein
VEDVTEGGVEDVQEGDEEEDEEPDDFGIPAPVVVPDTLLPAISAASLLACETSCRAGLAADSLTPALVTQLLARLQALRDDGHATAEEEDRKLAELDGGEAAKAAKGLGDAAFKAKNYKEAAARYGGGGAGG